MVQAGREASVWVQAGSGTASVYGRMQVWGQVSTTAVKTPTRPLSRLEY